MLSNFFWEGVGVGVCLAWVIYELLCFYGCHSLHSYDFVLLHVLMCMKVNNEWEKQNPVAGRHFQLEKLVQQVEQHQFLMKFSTEPKVSSCATLRHINALLPFLLAFSLNKFSSEVIAERAPVPPSSRVICERHTISVVPVTRVTMSHRNRSFSFYIIGFSREVYLKDYYPSRFCWGLCPCLEWLKL